MSEDSRQGRPQGMSEKLAQVSELLQQQPGPGGAVRGARRQVPKEEVLRIRGGDHAVGARAGAGIREDGQGGSDLRQGEGQGEGEEGAQENAAAEGEIAGEVGGADGLGDEDGPRARGGGAGEGDEGDGPGEGSAERPVTLAELAEQIGARASDLYSVVVDMGPEDESDPKSKHRFASVEELKAAGKEVESLRREVRDVVQARTDVEIERNQALREVYAIGEVIRRHGVDITPALMARAREVEQEQIGRERQKLLAHLPDWRKDDVRARERAIIVKQFGKRFGLSEAELGSVTSHKYVLAMRQAALDWEAADQARARAQPKLSSNGGQGRSMKPGANSGAATRLRELAKRAKSGSKADKAAYIAKLIGG